MTNLLEANLAMCNRSPKMHHSLTQLFHFHEYIPRELLSYEVSIAEKKPTQVPVGIYTEKTDLPGIDRTQVSLSGFSSSSSSFTFRLPRTSPSTRPLPLFTPLLPAN